MTEPPEEVRIDNADIPERPVGGLSLSYEAALLQKAGYEEKPYNAERAENEARQWFMLAVLAALALILLAGLVTIFVGAGPYNRYRDFLLFILPLEGAGIGAVASYYFGVRVVR